VILRARVWPLHWLRGSAALGFLADRFGLELIV
jgi:hypothetical protein